MKQRKPQPSPVGVVFRGHHEGRAGSPADAMRAMERNAEAEKADLKTKLPSQKTNHQQFCERSEEANYERSELTEEKRRMAESELVQIFLI